MTEKSRSKEKRVRTAQRGAAPTLRYKECSELVFVECLKFKPKHRLGRDEWVRSGQGAVEPREMVKRKQARPKTIEKQREANRQKGTGVIKRLNDFKA